MTTYSISADAQPLFPDGLNEVMTLFNQGPWTVFLDDNSSIGVQSYALKPSMTMVWPAGRALWAKGNTVPAAISVTPFATGSVTYAHTYQPSTLVATRGRFPAASQFGTTALYPIRRSTFNVNNVQVASDYPFEADSYQSLCITLNTTPFITGGDGPPALTQSHFVHLVWFDELGNLVTSDKFQLWYQGYTRTLTSADGTLIPQRITTPVKGKYCVLYHEEAGSGQSFTGAFDWIVQGSTLPLTPSMDHWAYSNTLETAGSYSLGRFAYNPIWWRSLLGVCTNTDDYAYIDAWSAFANPVLFNNPKRKLTFSVRGIGITTAGTLLLHSQDNNLSGGAIWQTVTIPIGTNTVGPFTVPLPITAPSYFGTGGGLVGTALRLSLNWSD